MPKINWRKVNYWTSFIAISLVVFSVANTYLHGVSQLMYYGLTGVLVLIFIVSWSIAGQAVMKSFFLVGAELSLTIFVSQSYCNALNRTRYGDDSLRAVIVFALLYIVFDFARSIYRDMSDKHEKLVSLHHTVQSWFVTVLLGLFTGVYVWQIYQILWPIFSSLCVFR